ncbi:MAG: hypothetical protein WBX11_07815 [Thiobacillaceae bacterium]
MYERLWYSGLATAAAALMMLGCGGNKGSAGPAPTNVNALAGDGQATISWTPTPGVYDWLWLAQSAADVIIGNSGNATTIKIGVTPPYVMGGLTNGLPYSFALNGHSGDVNAPGGAQSSSVSATPRLADTWTTCANCPTSVTTLYGVAFGDNGTAQTNGETIHTYLVVGSGGAMFTSLDAQNWTALPGQINCTPSSGGALRAAAYGWGTFVALGDAGTICFSGPTSQNSSAVVLVSSTSPSTASWFKPTTNPLTSPLPNLYAVATNQSVWNATSGTFVAVGSSGTVIYSGNGDTWYLWGTPATTNELYAVHYNSCGLPNLYWVTVGANGTILYTTSSSPAVSWTAVPAQNIAFPNGISSSTALRGIACTPNSTPSPTPGVAPATTIPLWVAAGDNGVLLTSKDGLSWATPANFTINGNAATKFPNNVQNITFGSQFVAIGDNGAIYTSPDGATWTTQSSGLTSSLYGIAQPQGNAVPNANFGFVPYGYSAVGAAGMTTFGH